jgi:hypothetical protein
LSNFHLDLWYCLVYFGAQISIYLLLTQILDKKIVTLQHFLTRLHQIVTQASTIAAMHNTFVYLSMSSTDYRSRLASPQGSTSRPKIKLSGEATPPVARKRNRLKQNPAASVAFASGATTLCTRPSLLALLLVRSLTVAAQPSAPRREMLEIANGRRCRQHEIDATDIIFMMVSSRIFF